LLTDFAIDSLWGILKLVVYTGRWSAREFKRMGRIVLESEFCQLLEVVVPSCSREFKAMALSVYERLRFVENERRSIWLLPAERPEVIVRARRFRSEIGALRLILSSLCLYGLEMDWSLPSVVRVWFMEEEEVLV
jgi:hypothetical protein